MIEIWLQVFVVLASIIVGAKIGGAGLGMAGGVGLFILTFVFGLRPAAPPVAVMLIITAVVTAAATMQAAGGLDYLIMLAERLLRKNPSRITFMAPVVSYLSTIFAGTGFVSLALYPVISEVATEAGIRPERPLSISLVANQQAICASPLSAATAGMIALLAPFDITLGTILMITVPTTIIGSFLGALSVYNRGVELKDDPVYQEKVARGELIDYTKKTIERTVSKTAKLSVYIFAAVVLLVIIFGSFRFLLPTFVVDGRTVTLSIPDALQILMLAASCIMVLCCKVNSADVIKTSVFQSGMMGVVSVFGVAWMMDTFFAANRALVVSAMSDIIYQYPWLFAIALFFLSSLFFSHAATVSAIMPLGLTLGIPPIYLVGMFTAVSGYFFIPTGGLTIACVAFDRTGTTKIGRFLLNHSFMRPGLVTVIVSTALSFGLVYFLY